MYYKTDAYIKSKNLFHKKNKILVAVSGGCDSVALTHILCKLEYNICLAHCNFKLRGKESDADEHFVIKLASSLNLKLFVKSFKTKEFAKQNNYSIEEAARILRYNWFEELRINKKLDYITTAHHLEDKIETFFINITAGTGIKGLRSIKAKNNKIVRPLLFAKRIDIENWCTENNIEFRIDKSNFETKFTRNKFRHKILPLFKEINPAFTDSMSKNFEIISDIEKIYNNYIDNAANKIKSNRNELIYLDIDLLKNEVAAKSVLFELINPYGFNSAQSNDIINSIEKMQTGKEFISEKYRLIKDRNYLIINKQKEQDKNEYIIKESQNNIDTPLPLQIEKQSITKSFQIEKHKNIAYFDAEKITFPLIIRKKKEGDIFHPFGMNGKKLISDYFTDIKLNKNEKEATYLLISGNEIIWVIGYRTDDRFKITDDTKEALIVRNLFKD